MSIGAINPDSQIAPAAGLRLAPGKAATIAFDFANILLAALSICFIFP